MNGPSYCLALYQTWEIPRLASCSVGAYAFQSCVRLQSVCLKSSRRHGKCSALIPSALLHADLLITIIHSIYSSGGLQTLTTILNTILCKKSSRIFHNPSRKFPITTCFSRYFPNFSQQKFVAFFYFRTKPEFFITYIDTHSAFMMKFYQ